MTHIPTNIYFFAAGCFYIERSVHTTNNGTWRHWKLLVVISGIFFVFYSNCSHHTRNGLHALRLEEKLYLCREDEFDRWPGSSPDPNLAENLWDIMIEHAEK